MEKINHLGEIKLLVKTKLPKTENYLKLSALCYELADIESVLEMYYKPIDAEYEDKKALENRILFLGIIFLFVATIRLYRYSSNGNYFMLFGVVTALGIAFMYLKDKR